jgi:hypothetical protein
MRQRKIALTGPAAAAMYGLDGFREQTWPLLWCAPNGSDTDIRVITMRDWPEPVLVQNAQIAPMETVLRHLNAKPKDLLGRQDGLRPLDRVELAVEHAFRLGVEPAAARGGRQSGDALLRQVLRQRGDQPPTESYAETRAAQLLRGHACEPWRQIWIGPEGRGGLRADFMIPFRRGPRPATVLPSHGLLVELDSREFHEGQFERDHDRGGTLNALGYHWISITPTQVETHPHDVLRSIDGALRRGRAARSPTAAHGKSQGRPTAA